MSRRILVALALSMTAPLLAACGAQVESVPVSFALSDSPIGALDAVVITIDRIVINRSGDDIVIDEFHDENGGPDTDTIMVDLLDVRGADYKVVVEDLDLEVGHYQNLRISIVDEDLDASWVDETGGGRKLLKVPSGELKLGGFEVTGDGPHVFVLEFALTKAMTYNPGPDRYILKPRGVRIVDLEEAALVEGTVDPALFDGSDPCDLKPDATVGNVMYIYRGHDLDLDALGDVFDPDVDADAAATLVEPYASEAVGADGTWTIAYLPSGDYTFAFACDAEGDDAEVDDGILIPNPDDQWVELSLAPGEDRICDFPVAIEGEECG